MANKFNPNSDAVRRSVARMVSEVVSKSVILVRTKGTDPRTTRWLQPDNTWGISSTAQTFKTFKLAELHLDIHNLQADGYAVKVVK